MLKFSLAGAGAGSVREAQECGSCGCGAHGARERSRGPLG